jgi:hypothetical protein
MSDEHRHLEDDPDLVSVGAALRAQGRGRTGDLPSLMERSRDRQRRVRVGVAVISAIVVLGIGGAIARGTTRDAADLRVGDAPAGATTSRPITSGATAPAATGPRWTVNPSIPIDEEQVWAVRIVFDRDIWNQRRYSEIFDLAYPYGANAMADHRDEPVLDLYWKGGGVPPGQDPRPRVEEAAAALRALPGIVSVEVGTAVPTKRTPATRNPFPNGSAPTPTAQR